MVNDTVSIMAEVRWDNMQVSHIRAYVDNKDVCDVANPPYNGLSCQKVFTAGKHSLVVIAWNNAGNYIEAAEYFTVR